MHGLSNIALEKTAGRVKVQKEKKAAKGLA